MEDAPSENSVNFEDLDDENGDVEDDDEPVKSWQANYEVKIYLCVELDPKRRGYYFPLG